MAERAIPPLSHTGAKGMSGGCTLIIERGMTPPRPPGDKEWSSLRIFPGRNNGAWCLENTQAFRSSIFLAGSTFLVDPH